jgi:hypothetical protein
VYRFVWFLLGSLLPFSLKAQWLEQGGGRLAALGYGGSAIGQELWQTQANPAGLAGLSAPAIGAAFSQHFLVSELSRASAVGAFAFQDRHFLGLAISSVGFAGYRETLTGLTYAIQLGQLSFGARGSVLAGSFAEYGTQQALLFDAGVQIQLSPQLRLGAWAANPARTGYPDAPPRPSQLQLGLAYTPSATTILLFDAQRPTGQPWAATLGLEYKPTPLLPIRVALTTSPLRVSAGLGLRWLGLQLHIATSYQSQLGTTPTFAIDHAFQAKEAP